jgi:hypothetical protein
VKDTTDSLLGESMTSARCLLLIFLLFAGYADDVAALCLPVQADGAPNEDPLIICCGKARVDKPVAASLPVLDNERPALRPNNSRQLPKPSRRLVLGSTDPIYSFMSLQR